MKSVKQYPFYKTKYGDELLIDVVELKCIKKFLKENPVHTLTYFDITLITNGKGVFYIDEQKHNVKKRDVIFSFAGQIRSWDIETIEDGYALIFEEEFILSFFNDRDFLRNLSYFNPLKSTSKLFLSIEEYEKILDLILAIQKEILVYEKKNKHILRALLYQVLSQLDRIYQGNNQFTELNIRQENAYIQRFIDLVNEYFVSQHSLSFYADRLCITSNYLNDLVKNSLGTSAKRYIQNKLIVEAKRLLLYTTFSVSDIALELNYEDVSYFIRMFRTHVGISPLAFRKNSKS